MGSRVWLPLPPSKSALTRAFMLLNRNLVLMGYPHAVGILLPMFDFPTFLIRRRYAMLLKKCIHHQLYPLRQRLDLYLAPPMHLRFCQKHLLQLHPTIQSHYPYQPFTYQQNGKMRPKNGTTSFKSFSHGMVYAVFSWTMASFHQLSDWDLQQTPISLVVVYMHFCVYPLRQLFSPRLLIADTSRPWMSPWALMRLLALLFH